MTELVRDAPGLPSLKAACVLTTSTGGQAVPSLGTLKMQLVADHVETTSEADCPGLSATRPR